MLMSKQNPSHNFPLLSLNLFLTLLATGCFMAATRETAFAQTGEQVVAVVGGRQISQQEVDEFALAQIFPLQQQIHALRKAAVENLILRALLEGEAKKSGLSVAELKRKWTGASVEVPPGEVERVYLENAASFASMSPDEAKERIRLDLESQARMHRYREALARLRETSAVQLFLEEPRLPAFDSVENAPFTGARDAAVNITEFSDFQCEYCKGVQEALKQLLRVYGREVRLNFKHLPLDMHPQSFAAARAAFCAGEQDAFWPYHDALFAAAPRLSPETFTQLATRLNLNLPRFNACLESETSRAAVLRDLQTARRIGINGTPAFIVNGKLVGGALSFAEFKTIVERELRAVQKAPRPQRGGSPNR